MSTQQMKIDVLFREIEENIIFFDRRRETNKKRAFRLRLATIISTALITILLGVKTLHSNLLLDITLVLSVLVAIFNSVDGFYNHKELWVKDVTILVRLRELKRDLEFFSAVEKKESLSLEALDNYQRRLQDIFNEDVTTWSSIREDVNSTNSDPSA